MALGLYKITNGQGAITKDGSYANPIIFEAAPTGGIIEARFYLRMEDSLNEYLTAGRLYATDASGEDETEWFSFAPDEAGGPGNYDSEFLFELPLGSEMPVWIRVELPSGIEVEPKDDVRVAASYIRHTTDE